jgi:serine/threonine-protein kinase RsbT
VAVALVRHDELPVRQEEDVVRVRQLVRQWAVDMGFSLVEQTKIVTASSELARNTVIYGGGGHVRLEAHTDGGRRGLRLVFEDKGPGIPDTAQALRDGYTTGTGLGLGLGGARRLMDEFTIQSALGTGTRVTVAKWR